MKKVTTSILVIALMIFSSFVFAASAEEIDDEENEEGMLNGPGIITGFVTKTGVFGRPVGVRGIEVRADGVFGAYIATTNFKGQYYMYVQLGPNDRPTSYDVSCEGITMKDIMVQRGDPSVVNFHIDIPESEEIPEVETPESDDESNPSQFSPISLILKLVQKVFSLFA